MNAVHSYFNHFETLKRVRVRSKSLRWPELVVTTLLAGLLFYKAGYRLQFMRKDPSLAHSVRMRYYYSETNWWNCWTQGHGDCIYDLPSKNDTSFCNRNATMKIWDSASHKSKVDQVRMHCRYFNLGKDPRETPGSVQVTTMAIEMPELWKPSGEGRDGQWVQKKIDEPVRYYTLGAEQLIRIDGGFNSTSLTKIQGFIKLQDEEKARRIRCAAHKEWKESCSDPGGLAGFWEKSYPEVSGGDEPEFRYDTPGCFSVEDNAVYCHLPELFKAAGIDLDEQTDDKPSLRTEGGTLDIHMTITNMDPDDYWTWPFGTKLKYVLEVKSPKLGVFTPMWSDYNISADGQGRLRVDRYGFDINLQVTQVFGRFDIFQFVTIFAILVTVMNYAKLFVMTVLIQVYRHCGMKHISALFEYNVSSETADEEQLKYLLDPVAFKAAHERVADEYLMRLLEVEADSSKGLASS